MELFEYIKSQLPQMPNVQIMKDMGASDELVEYIKESPENTNLNVMGSIANPSGDSDTGEIWFIGNSYNETESYRAFELDSVDTTDHATELFTNGENYTVYLNGEELPYYQKIEQSGYTIVGWADTEEAAASTKNVAITKITGDTDNKTVQAVYMNVSTAPTSVEVSVKAK